MKWVLGPTPRMFVLLRNCRSAEVLFCWRHTWRWHVSYAVVKKQSDQCFFNENTLRSRPINLMKGILLIGVIERWDMP